MRLHEIKFYFYMKYCSKCYCISIKCYSNYKSLFILYIMCILLYINHKYSLKKYHIVLLRVNILLRIITEVNLINY